MSPAVSIILPTFNRRQFLGPTIDSVLAQSFSSWELIIADDGSDDETRAYLEARALEPRVRLLRLAHSGRPAIVRNAAIEAARGELIAFIDSDDLWLPEKLQRQVEALRRHPSRKWSYTRFGLVNEKCEPIHPGRTPPARSGWVLAPLLEGSIIIALPSVVLSRQLLEEIGPFDEQFSMCEDEELWLRCAAASEIEGIDEPLTLVRRHRWHSGSDVMAWTDRRRVFEKMLNANAGGPFERALRERRAAMSGGLARSQVSAGARLRAFGTIVSSLPHSWKYGRWWRDALGAAARALAPARMRRIARALRARRSRSGRPTHAAGRVP